MIMVIKQLLAFIIFVMDINNNLIIQWGKQETINAVWNITFPISFTVIPVVTLGPQQLTHTERFTISSISETGHEGWYYDYKNGIINWLAIGY